MGDIIFSVICNLIWCIPTLVVLVISLVVAYRRVRDDPEKLEAVRKMARVSLSTADRRERSETIKKIMDEELDVQSLRAEQRGCLKAPNLVKRIQAILIAGGILFVILIFPDLVGQFPDDWLSFLGVFAVIGALIWWGLALPRPRLDMLRDIWAERFEKKVDLSDVEVPQVDEWIE